MMAQTSRLATSAPVPVPMQVWPPVKLDDWCLAYQPLPGALAS